MNKLPIPSRHRSSKGECRHCCNGLRALSVALLALSGTPRYAAEERVIIGRVENVLMQDVGMQVKARIDTGAGVSSINAMNIRVEPTEDGRGEIAHFDLTDDRGRTRNIRRPIVDWASIKIKGGDATIRRPVVIMDICLAGKKIEARFNLADRQHFLYPVLVGRNTLKTGDFLIDPKRKFMEKPDCS